MSRRLAPSAMMRLFRSIGSVPGFAGGLCAYVLAASPPCAGAQVPPDPGEAPRLPLPVEEIESAERLDETRSCAAFSGRVSVRDGSLVSSGVSAAMRRGSWGAGATVWHRAGSAAPGEAAVISATGELDAARGRVRAVIGRVGVRGMGVLFGERLGTSSRAARLPSARAALLESAAPSGARSRGLEGAAATWRPHPGARSASLWALAGRWSDGSASAEPEPLAALGAVVPLGASAVAAPAVGMRSGSLTASVAARTASGSWDGGVEAVASRAGFALLADAGVSAPPFRWRGRWRYRAGDTRPTAGEVSAEARSRHGRLALRVSGGASGATGATERRELEGRLGSRRGAGPLSFRLGRASTTGFTAADGFTERRERYVVLDLTVARAEGRAFSVTATRRERATEQGGRTGASAGGRLELAWRRRGRLEIRVEAVRVEAGASAWSSGVFAGGATALRSRTKAGVAASARGEIRTGGWRLGGVVEGREDEAGRHATAATVWIERWIPFITRGIGTR